MPTPDTDVDRFIRDGAVRISGAFSQQLADECRGLLWEATGCDEHDRSTWTTPVVRIDARWDPPFVAAANTPRLHAAFDQFAGIDRWVPPAGLGTFPIRFPSEEPPGDDGWHIEATGTDGQGRPIVDPASRERVLLMLFLFSDVGPDDAPTRIRLGSHLPSARRLTQADGPIGFDDVIDLAASTAGLPEAYATGAAGDVWLCHPFLVHAAQPHHGNRVRFMAQPPLAGTGPIDPHRSIDERSPVERAVGHALNN